MITTTLNRIRQNHPCHRGWTKLLKGLGKKVADDEPLNFLQILDINGLDDTIWCFRAEPDHAMTYRKVALAFARGVSHLSTDPRVAETLNVVERYTQGKATDRELDSARAAARAAAEAGGRAAAWAAAWAADARISAADSARAAADVAWAAADVAWAARAAADAVTGLKQTDILRRILQE